MPQTYLDFDLEIGAGDGLTYPLAVLHSPAGSARGQMVFLFRELELENRLLALQNALLRSGGARRKVLTAEERLVRDFGQALFAALFPASIVGAHGVQYKTLGQTIRVLPGRSEACCDPSRLVRSF